jgi:hypothetical protein
MGLMDLLQQYANAAPAQANDDAADHFHEVARTAPADIVGQGIAAMFRSDQTPPFGQMVGQLFGQANPAQQTDMVNQLLGALGPGAAAALAGGGLAKLLGGLGGSGLTSQQAAQLTPQQVQQLADHAEQQDPTIIDSMGRFYAQHSGLVKTIGGAALTIALSKIASNMRSA